MSRLTITLAAALAAGALLSFAGAVRAEESCGDNVTIKQVHYLQKSVPAGDPRCDPLKKGAKSDAQCKIDLKGTLYLPKGTGKHPVVIFNHGAHGSDYCAVAKVFTNHGYIFFTPYRRGHNGSTG